ncbi:unnamed protein product [Symbiodinium sp. CCMP2592]|nr:unnamed protein product [Symbiodinium sp. CCMP2592]
MLGSCWHAGPSATSSIGIPGFCNSRVNHLGEQAVQRAPSRLAAVAACGGFAVSLLLRKTRRHLRCRSTKSPNPVLKKANAREQSMLDRLNDHAAALGGECLAIGYRNNKTKVPWQCQHGHAWDAVPHSVLFLKSWCPECARNRRRIPLQRLQDHAARRGGKCLAKKYVNSRSKVQWECEHGHSWRAKPEGVLYKDSWCPHCRKIGLPRLRAHAASLGGRCLAKSYKNRREKLLWECKEGHRWEASAGSVLHHQTWCPQCAASTWRTEAEIRSILETIFHPASFPTCYPPFLERLQLDGYCLDLGLAFEYQGEQHYDPEHYFHFGEPSSFRAQQERDARKVNLCMEAGVRLLIVPCFVNDKRTFVLTALLQWFSWAQITPKELPDRDAAFPGRVC